jgi:Tfp pilus assembly protein FimT
VVIVLAVLAGINIPNLKKTYSRLKLENCALNILSIGRYARQKAITQSLTQRLNFDLINNTYYLSQENDNDPEEFERIQGRFSGIFKIPQEILLESSAQFLDFYPDGDCDNVSIALSNSDNLRYKLIKSGVFGEFKIEKQKD